MDGEPARPPPALGRGPHRPSPWPAPTGRELLPGVAVLFVLLAILVAVSKDGEPLPRAGAAEPLPRAPVAASTPAALPEWSDVPLATSAAQLGPALSRPVADGLAAARARIDRCVDVERRRRPAAGGERGRDAEPVELVLHLTPRASAVHVVAVEQRSPGGSPVLAECARRQLDGDAFPAPGGVAGRRYRLLVALP